MESVSLASRHGDEFPPLRRHDGHLFLENFIQHPKCSDSFGRTTMWIFTSVTSAVCSSLSAMPTHTLASSVLASPSVFDRGHIVPPPRCRRARRVGDPGDKVGQLVSTGEGLPQVMFAVVISGYVGWSPIFVFRLRLRWTTRCSRFIPRVGGSILVFPPYIPENVFSSTPWIEGSILSSLCLL